MCLNRCATCPSPLTFSTASVMMEYIFLSMYVIICYVAITMEELFLISGRLRNLKHNISINVGTLKHGLQW